MSNYFIYLLFSLVSIVMVTSCSPMDFANDEFSSSSSGYSSEGSTESFDNKSELYTTANLTESHNNLLHRRQTDINNHSVNDSTVSNSSIDLDKFFEEAQVSIVLVVGSCIVLYMFTWFMSEEWKSL